MKTAQTALEDYIKNGRPELYNATLEDIYKLWSDTHYKRVSESGKKLYSSIWKRFREIQDMKISCIRTAHFQKIINSARSKSTAEISKALASMLCNFAMENDVVNKNYANFVKLPKFEQKEKLIFTPDQISLLWKHTDDKRIQIILTMIYMGFRIGEIIALNINNIDLEQGYIIAGEKTEAGKNRVIPFPPNIPEIKEFVISWIDEALPNGFLFDMDKTEFRNTVFYDPLIELGLLQCKSKPKSKTTAYTFEGDHLTPHSTRHTFASLSAAAGMRQESLKKIIGHANYSTTADVYIHQDIKELKSEMTKLIK